MNAMGWVPDSPRPARVRKPSDLPSRDPGCCSMAAAVRSARRGRYRLAARYVRMTPRFLARRFA